MKKKTKSKVFDGRMQIGITTDWILKDDSISYQAKILYITIAEQSFNRFKKRWTAIGLQFLPFNGKTLYKYRDELVLRGFIEWKDTSKYTIYRVVEPKIEIKNFLFRNDIPDDKAKQIEDKQEDEEVQF